MLNPLILLWLLSAQTVALSHWVFKFVLPQHEVFRTVVPRDGVFENVTVKCQLFDSVKTIMYSPSNVGVKECFEHVFMMFSWALSENQASIQLKCRLTALFLKQSCFRKHDFVVYVHNV